MKKSKINFLFNTAVLLILGLQLSCTDQIPEVGFLNDLDLIKPDQTVFTSSTAQESTITGSCVKIDSIFIQVKGEYVETNKLSSSILKSANIDCKNSQRFSITLNLESAELGFTNLSSNSLVLRGYLGRYIEDNAVIVQISQQPETPNNRYTLKVTEASKIVENKGYKFKVTTKQ